MVIVIVVTVTACQPGSQRLFVVEHVVNRGPGKDWLSHDQNFSIYLENFLQKSSTREVGRKIFELDIGNVGHVTQSALPGPSN